MKSLLCLLSVGVSLIGAGTSSAAGDDYLPLTDPRSGSCVYVGVSELMAKAPAAERPTRIGDLLAPANGSMNRDQLAAFEAKRSEQVKNEAAACGIVSGTPLKLRVNIPVLLDTPDQSGTATIHEYRQSVDSLFGTDGFRFYMPIAPADHPASAGYQHFEQSTYVPHGFLGGDPAAEDLKRFAFAQLLVSLAYEGKFGMPSTITLDPTKAQEMVAKASANTTVYPATVELYVVGIGTIFKKEGIRDQAPVFEIRRMIVKDANGTVLSDREYSATGMPEFPVKKAAKPAKRK